MNKKLPKQIENKLEKLHELLDQMEEVRIIDPQDPETWDSDTTISWRIYRRELTVRYSNWSYFLILTMSFITF